MLTLIEGLCRNKCKIVIYSRHFDKNWVSQYISPNILIIDNLEKIQAHEFDLAHIQHSSCVVDIRSTFPNLPILFSSLGILPFLEQPIPFDAGISTYLAISEEVEANLKSKGIPKEQIIIIRNLICSERFFPMSQIRVRPERILVLSYKMDDARKVMLLAAAQIIGASIQFAGGTSAPIPQNKLASAINEADIVVSLGRGVVESMLCGRVPLVFDVHGGDGLVTPDNLYELQTCNFSGRYHHKNYSVTDLVNELGKYRQEYGEELRKLAIVQFGIESNMPHLLHIYKNIAGTSRQMLPKSQQDILLFCSALAREDAALARQGQEIISCLNQEIKRIKSTFSWRITSPIRLMWNIFRNYIKNRPHQN